MSILYQSAYSTISFDKERNLMEFAYTPETAKMSVDSYKKDVERYFDFLITYKPLRMLSDMKEFYYSIAPEVQDWINTTLVPKLPYNPDAKTAMVMAEDLFSQVSLEQTVDDSLKVRPATTDEVMARLRYFADRDTAIEWLMQD